MEPNIFIYLKYDSKLLRTNEKSIKSASEKDESGYQRNLKVTGLRWTIHISTAVLNGSNNIQKKEYWCMSIFLDVLASTDVANNTFRIISFSGPVNIFQKLVLADSGN